MVIKQYDYLRTLTEVLGVGSLCKLPGDFSKNHHQLAASCGSYTFGYPRHQLDTKECRGIQFHIPKG